jgi:hypothetical protein
MRNYKAGFRSIPGEVAAKVREISTLGMPGLVIKRAMLRAFPECPPSRAHQMARYAEEDLNFYKLLRDGADRSEFIGRQAEIVVRKRPTKKS